jgi:hypothetical protein
MERHISADFRGWLLLQDHKMIERIREDFRGWLRRQEDMAWWQVRGGLLTQWTNALQRIPRYSGLLITKEWSYLWVREPVFDRRCQPRYPSIHVMFSDRPGEGNLEPEQFEVEIGILRKGKRPYSQVTQSFRLDQCDPVRVLTKVLDRVYHKILRSPEGDR